MAIKQQYQIPDPDGNGQLTFISDDISGAMAQAYGQGRKRGGREAAQRIIAKLSENKRGIWDNVNDEQHYIYPAETVEAAIQEEVQRGS